MNHPRYHALVLNLHQPPGNLDHLLDHAEWEAREILWALDRIPRSIWDYEDVARVHLSLSGSLLETLASTGFQQRVYGTVKCGDLLWYLRNPAIDILGTGYYHPVFPLIPPGDWADQMDRWLQLARHLFDRAGFDGFWPPEMGFCMEMIPTLRRFGYRFVLVDSDHVKPVGHMNWEELRYRPHIARHGGEEIVVVVRDRELSDAQEAGMDPDWFVNEIRERTKWCDFPPLVTTCSDGDNGGWFRNTNEAANYWGYFHQPLMARIREDADSAFYPTFIGDYLRDVGPEGEVTVQTGAWNTGWHNGHGFIQWTGSQEQKDALRRVGEVSDAWRRAVERAGAAADPHAVEQARWRILRAETSCNFFWGADWVGRAHADLDEAGGWIERIGSSFT